MSSGTGRNFVWTGKKALVTGGASFIGSNLAEELIRKGAEVRVVDNLSSGRMENIQNLIDQKKIEFIKGDLLDQETSSRAVQGMHHVFHLAADHGGRGYVDLHPVECSTNLILDGMLFRNALKAGVEKVTFASSGCVYPNHIQNNVKEILYLDEQKVGPPYDSDNLYGWAKLMGEMTLRAYHKQYGLKAASCRYFTVYGPKGVENHAVIAMIARAFIKETPFEVWGTGEQIRNWTYIDDIVRGTVLAAERIDDGTAVNLGTMERIRVMDAVHEVLKITGHQAPIKTLPGMPTGPYNRVADNHLAKELLGWEPSVPFMEGLRRTIDWYFSVKNPVDVKSYFKRMLTER